MELIFKQLITAILKNSVMPGLGSGGGSVMGAGKKPDNAFVPPPKKKSGKSNVGSILEQQVETKQEILGCMKSALGLNVDEPENIELKRDLNLL